MKTVIFHQKNLYCNNCMMNVVMAVSQINGINEFSIDMSKKTIRIQYENNSLGKKRIKTIINTALTTGSVSNMACTG